MIMGCNTTTAATASWRMVCDRNRWVAHGTQHNCTPGERVASEVSLSFCSVLAIAITSILPPFSCTHYMRSYGSGPDELLKIVNE